MKKVLSLLLIISLVLLGISFSSPSAYAKKYGEFVKTGKINQPRFKHESILLDDGRVLVLGGEIGHPLVRALSHAEVYHPDTGKFEVILPMHYRRVGFTVTKLADGRVLIVGGKGGPEPWVYADYRNTQKLTKDKILNTVELFDPKTNRFQKLENFSYPVIDHVVVKTPEGKVFLLGGYESDSQSSKIHKEVFSFDPDTLTFSKYMEMSISRKAHSGIAIDNQQIFVVGGETQDVDLVTCTASASHFCSNVLYDEILDLKNKAITLVQSPERNEYWKGLKHPPLFLVLTSKVLINGSELFNPSNNSYEKAYNEKTYKELYNNSRKKWIKNEGLKWIYHEPKKTTITLLKNNLLFIAGGDDPNHHGFNPHVVEIYDLNNYKYKIVGTLKYRRYEHSATRLENGNIILIGGYGGNSKFLSKKYASPVMRAEIFEVN